MIPPMKKRFISPFILAFVLCFTYHSLVEARHWNQTSRQGFYLSGLTDLGMEVLETQNFGFGFGMRAGYGLKEDIILLMEATGNLLLMEDNVSNILFLDAVPKVQYYFMDSWYTNLGIGFTLARLSIPGRFLAEVKYGFAVSYAIGYEWRFGRTFFLGPEVRLDYRRISGVNFLSPMATFNLGWHF